MIDVFDCTQVMMNRIPSVSEMKRLAKKSNSSGVVFFTKGDPIFDGCYAPLIEIRDYLLSSHDELSEYFLSSLKELDHIDNVQYSNCATDVERGYYCQLPYEKKKGTLLKRKSSFQNAKFKYYIKDDKLYCVESRDHVMSREFLMYGDNYTLGICNEGDRDMHSFAIRYDDYVDGKIVRHIRVSDESAFLIDNYEYSSDDVKVSRAQINVLHRMGKRYMISFFDFNGKYYTG